MPTIELVGGPYDGLTAEIDASFPDYTMTSYFRNGMVPQVYRLSCPAVTTQAGRLKYEWIRPEEI